MARTGKLSFPSAKIMALIEGGNESAAPAPTLADTLIGAWD